MARKTLEQIDAALARWQTRLTRSANAIGKLQRQRARMLKAKPPKAKDRPASLAETMLREIAEPHDRTAKLKAAFTGGDYKEPPLNGATEIDTTIPPFLRREKALEPAAAQIVAEQAASKRAKAAGRAARKAATKAGDTKRMPLTGRAALAAIRAGR